MVQSQENRVKPDLRIAIIGNVDSGKSTLLGVLTKCRLDDGRGSARSFVFNYSHEQANGRTSSIAQEIIGFADSGEQIHPERLTDSRNKTWAHIIQNSNHFITFIDLCGHQKYLKTTIFGLTGLMPDYAMIVIGANMGLGRMTKEHIGLALSLKVPMFFVLTKIDIAPTNIYEQSVQFLQKVLRSPSAGNRLPIMVDDETNLDQIQSLLETKVCPIFSVSNVTGEGLHLLRRHLFLLQPRAINSGMFGKFQDPPQLLIDGVFIVKGVGLVISGIMRSGTVIINQNLMLGPDMNGVYKPITVKGIHFKRTIVQIAYAGQSVCFSIKAQLKKEQIKRNYIKKGMVAVDKCLCPATAWEFDAQVVILHHATNIRPNYQPIIHCGVVRQAALVLSTSKDSMQTGDKGIIRFRFLYHPELIHNGRVVRRALVLQPASITKIRQSSK